MGYSRNENILEATIEGIEYNDPPQSRIEDLLLELKEVIEAGGGGGTGEVISVNGKKGVVTLDAEDVGALPDDTELFSGNYNDLNDKPDLSQFITNTVNNLVNYYVKADTYTKTEVDTIVAAIKNSRFENVATLPTEDIKTNVIYLVPKSTAQTDNVKDEYINLDGTTSGWEKIGDTEIDLSGYVTTTDLNTALAGYTTTADLTTLLADKADQAEVNDIVNVYGSKNLLSYPYYETTKTQNGVTFTDNGDGTVTANGTATADTYFTLHSRYQNDVNNLILKNGTYTLTGSPSSVSFTTLYLKIGRTSGGTYQEYGADLGSGVTVTLNGDDYSPNEVEIQVQIVVKSGATVSNLTFRPMIRLASIEDDTYVPYVPTNAKLDGEKVSWDDAAESVQKNLNSYPYADTTKTINGITFTDLGDGRIMANGTANAYTAFFCHNRLQTDANDLVVPNGKYILSGCPNGGSGSTYRIVINRTHNNVADDYGVDYGDGCTVTLAGDDYSDTSVNVGIIISIFSGVTVNNLIFEPMLRKATIKDDTWQPYIHNNKELVSWKANGVLGAKNLIPYPYKETTHTKNGITFTDNGDGTVTANGTATADSNFDIASSGDNYFRLPIGRYILSGCPSGGGSSTYWVHIAYNDGTYHRDAYDYGDGSVFTRSVVANTGLSIYIKSGVTVNNLTFKPMLRLAEDTDNTYQPYAMTNRELTESVASINSDLTELAKPYITSNSGAIIDNGQIIPTAAGGGVVFQLPFGTSKVHFKLENSSQVQAGNCLPGSTLPTIITQGTGRSEFNNYSTSGDQSFDFHGAAGWFYIGSGSSGSQNTISNIWCELL